MYIYFVYIPSHGSCSMGNSENGSTSLILPDISTLTLTLTNCQSSVITMSTRSDSSSTDGDRLDFFFLAELERDKTEKFERKDSEKNCRK